MILVCGEALFDLFCVEDRKTAMTLDARPGGSPFNVACGLARLGQRAAFLGGISDDLLGERLVWVLQTEGVSAEFVQRNSRPTTLSIVGVGSEGSPAYAFYGDRAADRALKMSSLPRVSESVRAIHVGSFSTIVEPIGSALYMLVRREASRRLIAYDPNVRLTIEPDLEIWRRKIKALAPYTHVLKISAEDLTLLFPGEDPAGIARQWIEKGVCVVVLTRGADGVSAWTASGSADISAVPVKIVDTVGAGDTFQAALLTGLAETSRLNAGALRGIHIEDVRNLLTFAATAAAITCSRRGADMPRRSELPPLTRT